MADVPSGLVASLADRYRIEREVGRGGMAIVHLAHDLKHDRKVALKVLRPELAALLGARRFLNEIRVTAKLQHPNILPLFDSGETAGFLYYVMPFVRGETLRDRLEREGRIDVEEALAIAREVALALDYAHREGVVHRDVKPANVLLSEGRPLVADFGIALAVAGAGEARLTSTGVSIGTPSYMSPEQAAGDEAPDARADVYALGCVLYEMLAGEPPHVASNPQALIAKILTQAPAPLVALRDAVPSHVDVAVARALAKEPADRWRSAAAFAEALATPATVAEPVRRGRTRLWAAAGLGATTTAVVLLAVALGLGRGGTVEPAGLPTMTSAQVTSFLGREHAPSWSPDGSMITFGHTLEGHSDIFVMSVPEGDPQRLTTHPADDALPRWSPTGEWIAFVSDRGAGIEVMLIAPTGGRERTLASTQVPISEDGWVWFHGLGADAWSPDGQRLLIPRRDGGGTIGIWTVDLATGEPTRLTSPPPGLVDLGASYSPDGSVIAFDRGQFGSAELWVMAADGSGQRPLPDPFEWAYGAAWTPDGRGLVFSGDWNLWTRAVGSGQPRPLTTGYNWIFGVDVGPRGQIAYSLVPHLTNLYEGVPGDAPDQHERLTEDTLDEYGARMAPDGRRVAYSSDRNGPMDIWTYDREAGEHVRLTRGPAIDQMPDWLPDGGVVFVSNRGGAVTDPLWVVESEAAQPRPFTSGAPAINCGVPYCRKGPNVSPDGLLVGFIGATELGETLWVTDVDGSDPRPTRIRAAQTFDWYLDSRRVIYTTTLPDGSGRIETRAASLVSDEEVLLYAGSATEPAVTRDGRTVAFLNAASHYNMNAFVLDLEPPADAGGLPLPVGEPRPLIDGQGVWHVHNLDWTGDGGFFYTRDEDTGDIFVLRPIDGGGG